MTSAHRQHKPPNLALKQLLEESGTSRESLARRVNSLSQLTGKSRGYTHTSVSNWIDRGMIPHAPVPSLIAAVLGERLGRPVSLDDIGMGKLRENWADMGLDFPRDPEDALRLSVEYWSSMLQRRTLLTGGPLAIAAYHTPVRRWLAKPADEPASREGGRQVGRADLNELWHAAEDARRWDSKYGGGNARASSVTEVLQNQAAPLLRGTYTEALGAELFTATAELARVAAWAAVDTGQHGLAQQHFIQALRLARSAGDVQTGSYVMATMSLHAYLQGHVNEAIDMAEGAYERGKHHAAPRVIAFAKLAEARAHGKAGDARAASRALATAENLLASIRPGTRDPQQLAYLTHARISTDAVEISRDLGDLKSALRWSRQADAMPIGVYTRAVGIRLAVLSSAHIKAGNLDQGLDLGERAVDVLSRVNSPRAHDYVRQVNHSLQPWGREGRVRDFVHRSTTTFAAA
ncbi:sporulation protein [Streptomyces sp. NPDC057430]|uniref:sporulation protein n=1 Tax=Streptomyces sp. NPDC057430 TaxID=3346131 RepID=UPI003698B692